MSCEDLPELEAKLKEATEQEARDLIELLQTLPITFTQLCTSKISKTVKHIYKKYPGLKSAGKELISTWKQTHSKRRSNIFKELSKVVKSKELAAELEGALHSAFEKADYDSKSRLVLHILKNKTLKKRLLQGDLKCSQLIQMIPAEAAAYQDQQLEDSSRNEWTFNKPKDSFYKNENRQTYPKLQPIEETEEIPTYKQFTYCHNTTSEKQPVPSAPPSYYSQSIGAPLSTSVLYGKEPVMVVCYRCSNQGYTKAKRKYGVCTCLSCCGCLAAGWYCCCLAPFFMPPLHDVKHYCSVCKALLGDYALIGF
jgi:hypothetical protein